MTKQAGRRFQKYCDTCWPGFEHPLNDAVETILESTGEMISDRQVRRSVMRTGGARARHSKSRSCKSSLFKDPGFVDRFGVAHLPFDSAIQLTQAFAVVEPHTVLLQADTDERDIRTSRLVKSATHTWFRSFSRGEPVGPCAASGQASMRRSLSGTER